MEWLRDIGVVPVAPWVPTCNEKSRIDSFVLPKELNHFVVAAQAVGQSGICTHVPLRLLLRVALRSDAVWQFLPELDPVGATSPQAYLEEAYNIDEERRPPSWALTTARPVCMLVAVEGTSLNSRPFGVGNLSGFVHVVPLRGLA